MCAQFLHITQITNDTNFWGAVYAVLSRFGRGQVKWRNALKKAENKLIGACPKAYTEAGIISPVNEAGCKSADLVAVPWSRV